MLPLGSYDVCNMAALIPADGWYQSHPRSPVVRIHSKVQLGFQASSSSRSNTLSWQPATSIG
jgi:hypothetical protein